MPKPDERGEKPDEMFDEELLGKFLRELDKPHRFADDYENAYEQEKVRINILKSFINETTLPKVWVRKAIEDMKREVPKSWHEGEDAEADENAAYNAAIFDLLTKLFP